MPTQLQELVTPQIAQKSLFSGNMSASTSSSSSRPTTKIPSLLSVPQLSAYKAQLSCHLPFGVRIHVRDPIVAFKYSSGAKALSNFSDVDEPWVIEIGDLTSRCPEMVYQAIWPRLADHSTLVSDILESRLPSRAQRLGRTFPREIAILAL